MTILATKLHIPPSRQPNVLRSRLIQTLDGGLTGKLTLVSAPAGFGKTTLISEWVVNGKRPSAWFSLDESDNDPTRFLAHLIAALQTVAPEVGKSVLDMLQTSQPPSVDNVLATLVNDLATLSDSIILVLDDYHVIQSTSIDESLAFLLEHLPTTVHLVITTREDPPLPLARLRARNQLTELRTADLRFTPEEATDFLKQVMGLDLAADAIAALEKRTEGWIAGLQLAALSMRGHQDIESFIQSFTGSHSFVLDYLVEEVLNRQSDEVQQFLLQTSILERMCGSLCDALLGGTSGQQALEYLEQTNLFLIPLDNERRWYRYHHLFGDLLRQRLGQKKDALMIDDLHRRASHWYEENGFELAAFQHAAAAKDINRAEELIEGDGTPLYFRGAMRPVLQWLEALLETTLDARPSLWVMYGTVLTIMGHPSDVVEAKLRAGESALQNRQPRDLIGRIAAIRAMLAVPQGQIETIMTQSDHALTHLHPASLSFRTSANWTLGLAHQLLGNRAEARQAYTEGLAISEATDDTMMILATATGLGQVQEGENQLFEAVESYQRVLDLVGDLPYACEALLGLARIHYEWNDLDRAQAYGQKSLDFAQQLANVDTPTLCGVLLARVKLAQGQLAEASELLAQAEQFAQQNNFQHRMADIVALQTLVLLGQGNLPAAAHLAQGLSLSQARVYLAQGDPSKALTVLEPIGEDALADEQLRAMVLQALAHHTNDDRDRAVQVLADALAMAKPGGFVRLFLDEGSPMAELLSEVAKEGLFPIYTRKLLAAFQAYAGKARLDHPDLFDALTAREQDVLRLIVAGYSNPDIAQELFIAVTTVKTHAKNIYGKLDVDNRAQAIARAKDLNLF